MPTCLTETGKKGKLSTVQHFYRLRNQLVDLSVEVVQLLGMVRRSPAERYMKYLISHPDGFTNEQIRGICQLQDVPFIGMPYLERLRSLMPIPAPFYPENRMHTRSQRFIVKERIRSMYHPDEDMKGALAVLERPRQKEALEALLIARATPAYISAAMRQRDGIDISARGVKLYGHFFFDVNLVGYMEMRALMEVKSGVDSGEDPDESRLSAAMAMASKGDTRRLNARLTVQPLVGILEAVRRGYMPHNVDLGRMASIARIAAFAQTTEALSNGWHEGARDFAMVSKMMSEVLEDVGSAADDLQGDLAQMLLETETDDVPQYGELPPPNEVPQLIEAKGETVDSNS